MHPNHTAWLPTSAKEVAERGWDEVDVILFTGDAYVDHPSFGSAVVGRIIEKEGFRVAIVPQPNWRDDLRDFKKLGKPRLFFGVTGGAMDSMVNHYSVSKRKRTDDAYTPGGTIGQRPDYAVTTYTKILKKLYPETPVIIGGIEASLRRVTHFDYWTDALKPSVLVESGADLLVYGMGELPLMEILRLLSRGVPFENLTTVPQTAFLQPINQPIPPNKKWEDKTLVSHEICIQEPKSFARNFRTIETESNKWSAARLSQECGDQRIVINPPFPPMNTGTLDAAFDLPYTRLPHPRYHKKAPIPAYDMIKHSVNLHRGCFGGCTFCTISAHQGKFIASRSKASILKEVHQMVNMDDFKGYISDLGGPSANMYQMHGRDLEVCKSCKRPSCIHPQICDNLNTDHTALLEIYQTVDALPEVRKSFIGSGIRYDLFLNDKASDAEKRSHQRYQKELICNHVSGRLKVAPEHTSDEVLKLMRKPTFSLFHKFNERFQQINGEAGLHQELIPYFISSHPGCSAEEMAELAAITKSLDFKLEQVQDFTPTPMTLATVIYYSGYHPYTGKQVYTPRTKEEKASQRMFFFWYKPEHRQKITQKLTEMGRPDLLKKLYPKKRRRR